MVNRAAIQRIVRELHELLWKERARLPANSRPVDFLDPTFVASVLGVDFEVVPSLGTFRENGVDYRTAGIVDRNRKRISVSREFSPAVMRFTAAHEIGHWLMHPNEVMHRDRPIDSPDQSPRSEVESEAEYFAATFLMPPNLLKKDFEARFGQSPLVFDEGVALALGARNLSRVMSASEDSRLRERLLAKAIRFGQLSFDSLADVYGVSTSAMAGRLEELKLARFTTARGRDHGATDLVSLGRSAPLFARNSLLPTTSACLAAFSGLDNVRLVVLQHALRDTRIFLEEAMYYGATVGCFVAKPNSVNDSALADIVALGIPVVCEPPGTEPPYSYYENSQALGDLLVEQIDSAKKEQKKLVLVDVGGYFCKPLLERKDIDVAAIAGVIEVTTFGHRRYSQVESSLEVPVLSVARSPLKEAEAAHVGTSVARAAEDMLQKAGFTLSGKVALMIGYGMIGQRIAHALAQRHVRTIVYDQSESKMLLAHLDGFETQTLAKALKSADLIFASTGGLALGLDQLAAAKSGVVLFSGGSRKQEFDVRRIAGLAKSHEKLTEELEEFTLPQNFKCIVANAGKAVNFLKDGTPEEVIDLVFAEIAESIRHVVTHDVLAGKLQELPSKRRDHIAGLWLTNQRSRAH